ncbi:MAG: hypothetical protein M5U12_30480 [Verrucomicrobia bacterium]|nr:hypothetical protein [Verrucomicrobiota bacterium]
MRTQSLPRACLVAALLVLVFNLVQAVGDCVVAPAGLVGWWAANGDVLDTVRGWAGALAGDAGFAPGMVGQAFRLDGMGTVCWWVAACGFNARTSLSRPGCNAPTPRRSPATPEREVPSTA